MNFRNFLTAVSTVFVLTSGLGLASDAGLEGGPAPVQRLPFGLNQLLDGSYNQVEPRPFQTVMHPVVLSQFKGFFEIMFREDFPAPVHSLKTILKGFNCLYDRLKDINTHANTKTELFEGQLVAELELTEAQRLVKRKAKLEEIEAERFEGQRAELDKTLALHKKVLLLYLDGVKKQVDCIAEFACEACKQSATYELGVHEDGKDEAEK